MKIKKLLSLLAAAAMTVTALTGAMSVSAISAADGLATSGTWGTDGKWVLSQDGTLLVTGTGEVTNVTPRCKLGVCVDRLVVGEGVTKMSEGAVAADFYSLTEMVLPSTFEYLHNIPIKNDAAKPWLKDVYIYSKDLNNFHLGNLPKPGSGVVMHLYKDSDTEKNFRSYYDYTDEDIVYIEGDRPADPVLTPAAVEPLTETSGPSGLNSKWEYNTSNNTLIFSGKGTISIGDDYKKYAKTTEHIVIEEGITQIKANTGQVTDNTDIVSQAFYGFTAVKDVKLPNTLKVIGEGSFYQTPITKIDLPSSLETIERNAFKKSNLEEISFPESLKEIGEGAFAFSKLKSINLHEGMWIGGSAFGYCELLKAVTIPKNVFFDRTRGGGQGMAREQETFSYCTGLESITFEDGSKILDSWDNNVLTENGIGSNFCINCTSLKTVVIKGDVECIMARAFGLCTSLKDIYFYNTGLTTITAKGSGSLSPMDSIDLSNNPTFHVVKGSTTEQTLKDAGYLTDENTVYLTDYTALNKAIADAEAKDTSAYTEESVSALKAAIESGKKVLANENATQEEVDQAVKAINDAAGKLTKKASANTEKPNNEKTKSQKNAEAAMKQAKITKLTVKSKAKKKITVTWKKVSKAKGYQVQVSTNKKFKKSKIVFTKNVKGKKIVIKKLKSKKTYFVRVRAYATYKDSKGATKKAYSAWNKKVRKVKVK